MAVRKLPIDVIGLEFKEQTDFVTTATSTFTDLRAQNIKFVPGITMHPMPTQKPENLRGPDPSIVGGYGGTLTFQLPLRGGAGNKSEVMTLLKNMGTVTMLADDTGEVTASAAGTLTVATIANYAMNDAIIVQDDTNTPAQIRFVSDITVGTDLLAIEPNWVTAPTSGDDLYAIDTYIFSLGEPTKYLSFRCTYGAGATNAMMITLSGCAGTWKLVTAGANTVPMIEFTYLVDVWSDAETASTIGADSYGTPYPLLGSPLYIDDTATAVSEVAFDPGLKLVPYTATSGSHGRAGWLYSGDEPKIEITPWHDTTWYTRWETPTTFQLTIESIKNPSTDADEGWALHIPKCQVISVSPEEVESHVASKPEIIVVDPGKGTVLTTTNIAKYIFAVTGDGT